MPDLSFRAEGATAVLHAAAPLLALKLRIGNLPTTEAIPAVVLRCQVRIEANRRSYSADEQQRLLDLFGEPSRWGQTVRSLLWTHAHVSVPAFQGETTVDLPLPCSTDFNLAAARYFHALEEGTVPLRLLFSGTVFYEAEGALQVSPISWQTEAAFALPVRVWRDMMDHYYPNSAWLCLRKDVFDRLCRYRTEHGLPTWEQTLESLLAEPAGRDA